MSGGSGSGNSPPWRPSPKEVKGSTDNKGHLKQEGQGAATGGLGGGSDPCAIIAVFNLNSPDRSVISSLSAGDVLNVVYKIGPPQRLLAEVAGGGIAGSVTFPEMMQVVKCMIHQQAVYNLDVISVAGGMCKVRIHLQ